MAGEIAVDDVGGVGVGIEVDDADVAVAVHVGHSGGGGPRDRVVAAEDDRHDAVRGDVVDTGPDVGVTDLGLTVRAVGVAVVDHLEMIEDLDPQIEVVRARLIRQRPDRPRPEACPRPVGGGDVERCSHDRHIGLPAVELLGVGEERALAERADPAEHVPEIELFLHTR